MADQLALLLEAEKRGILPPDKQPLLIEARKRGIIPNLEVKPQIHGRGAMDYPENPMSTRESIAGGMKYLEPALEYGGAAVGAGLGGVVGAGAGYAGGRQVVHALREYTGEEKPATLGESAIQAAKDAPVGAAMELGGIALGKGIKAVGKAISKSGIPEKLMESAMKIPPRSVDNATRKQLIKTAVEDGYRVTQKGLDKLKGDIDTINKEIASVVDKGKDIPIDYETAVSKIDELKEFYKDAPNPKQYIDELESLKQSTLAAKLTDKGRDFVPAAEAQRIKQTVYRLNKKHYGEMKTAEIEGNKAIARGVKEKLVEAFPELKELNAKDSEWLNLEEVLGRAVNRSRNYDIIKLGDAVFATTGAVLGGKVGAVAAMTFKDFVEAPGVKSALAIALRKAGSSERAITSRLIAYPTVKRGVTGEW